MSTITENAWALIPGYNKSTTILNTLGLKKVPQGTSPVLAHLEEGDARAAVKDRIEQLLAAGKQIPDDIAAPVIDARRRDELAVARASVMNTVAQNHGDPGDRLNESTAPVALDYLRKELSRILDQAVDAGNKLGGATTAAEAIRTPGPAKAWQRLSDLADEYDELRDVQYLMTRKAVDSGTGRTLTKHEFQTIGYFADALDIHPTWLALRTANCSLTETGRAVEAYADWMANGKGQPWEASGVREIDLISTATDTVAWVPTPIQFTNARSAAEVATNRPTGRSIDRLEQARAAYYQTTGTTPATTFTDYGTPNMKSRTGSLSTGDRFIA